MIVPPIVLDGVVSTEICKSDQSLHIEGGKRKSYRQVKMLKRILCEPPRYFL